MISSLVKGYRTYSSLSIDDMLPSNKARILNSNHLKPILLIKTHDTITCLEKSFENDHSCRGNDVLSGVLILNSSGCGLGLNRQLEWCAKEVDL